MSYEQYGNLGATTVGVGGYTAGSGSLLVISTTGSPAFSTSVPFRISIEDPITFQVYVILKVTAITDSTHFAVTAEGTDANAAAGCNVYQTLTAGSLLQLISDVNLTGTYANLPATAGPAGYKYKCTDSPYEFISNGSVWQAYYRGLPATNPPAAANWSTENLGADGSLTDSKGALTLVSVYGAGSQSITTAYKAAPGSTPYSFVARFTMDYSGMLESFVKNSNTPTTIGGFFMGFRDSSGKYVGMNLIGYNSGNHAYYQVAPYSSYSSQGSSYIGLSDPYLMQGILIGHEMWWFRIRNDGTDLYFQLSLDGQTWYTAYSATITNYLSAATSVAWGAQVISGATIIRLWDWTQGT